MECEVVGDLDILRCCGYDLHLSEDLFKTIHLARNLDSVFLTESPKGERRPLNAVAARIRLEIGRLFGKFENAVCSLAQPDLDTRPQGEAKLPVNSYVETLLISNGDLGEGRDDHYTCLDE